eukprot:PhF_6_TR5493/c0_g1_i2/m.7761
MNYQTSESNLSPHRTPSPREYFRGDSYQSNPNHPVHHSNPMNIDGLEGLQNTVHSQANDLQRTLTEALKSLNSLRTDFGMEPVQSLRQPHAYRNVTPTRSAIVNHSNRTSPHRPRLTATPPPVRADVTRTPNDDVWGRLYRQPTEAQTIRMSDAVLREWREQKDYERQMTDLTFRPNAPPVAATAADSNHHNVGYQRGDSSSHTPRGGSPHVASRRMLEHLSRPLREEKVYEERRAAQEVQNCTFQPNTRNSHNNASVHSKSPSRVSDRLYKEAAERKRRQREQQDAVMKAEIEQNEIARQRIMGGGFSMRSLPTTPRATMSK